MRIVKPNEKYLKEYYCAVKESYDYDVKEWQPYFKDSYKEWSEKILYIFEMCEKGVIEGYPQMSTYWAVEGNKFIGEFQIRPYLSEKEAKAMGHLGYGVRYSMWRHGYGTRILTAGIKKLWKSGINPIYITCNKTNEGSRRTIMKCGGIYMNDQTAADGTIEELYYVKRKRFHIFDKRPT